MSRRQRFQQGRVLLRIARQNTSLRGRIMAALDFRARCVDFRGGSCGVCHICTGVKPGVWRAPF